MEILCGIQKTSNDSQICSYPPEFWEGYCNIFPQHSLDVKIVSTLCQTNMVAFSKHFGKAGRMFQEDYLMLPRCKSSKLFRCKTKVIAILLEHSWKVS